MELALAAIETLAVLALVGVTCWYARSTREILRETRRQADAAAEAIEAMRRQSRLLSISTLLEVNKRLGYSPDDQLVQAKKELEEQLREEG